MPSERLGAFLCFLGEKYLPKGSQLMLLERSRQGRGATDFCCRSDVLSVKKQAVCRPGAWRFGTSKSLMRRWLRQSERERPALDRRSGRGKPAACRKPPVLYRYSCRCKARDAQKNSIPVTKERKLWSYKKISLSQAGKRGQGRPLRAFGNLTGEEAELQGSFRFSLHFCLT